MKIIKFKTSSEAAFGSEKAESYGRELVNIFKQNDGLISPDDIVAAAAPAKSALHDYFEWDDTKAGALWRRQQARSLLNHFEIEWITPAGDTRIDKLAYSVYIETGEEATSGRKYVSIQTVIGSEAIRKIIIQEAMLEFKRLKSKYQHLKELDLIFAAIEETQKKLKF